MQVAADTTQPASPDRPASTTKTLAATRKAPPNLWQRAVKQERMSVIALFVVLLIIMIALLAPVLPLDPPNETDLAARLLPPRSPDNVLGTDQLGRDILSRLVWGGRVSLLVGAAAAVIASIGGLIIGGSAGYFRGVTDNILMRIIDILLAFPYVLLAIALVAALGPGLFNAMIAVGIVNISFFSRNVRGAVLTLRDQAYVEASFASGASHFHILMKHILPNIVAPMLVLISMNVGWMITETAGLSFLGLGAQPPQADWGSMLADGRQFITVSPHVATIPGIAILILVMCLNLIGDSLRDLLDPRLRGR